MTKIMDHMIAKVRCFDNPDKISIINLLQEEQEATLDHIKKKLQIKESTAYKYLKLMEKSGIVRYRKLPGKKGKMVYHIDDPTLTIDKGTMEKMFEKSTHDKILIIFDFDDTLVRRTDIPEKLATAAKNAINEARLIFHEKGIPISMPPKELFNKDWIYGKYGNSIRWYMSTWLSVSGVYDYEVLNRLTEKAVTEYFRNIEVSAPKCSLFDDVKTFLEKHDNHVYFAAMSNSSRKTIINTLQNNDILHYFTKDGKELVIGGDEIPKSKETVEALLKLGTFTVKETIIVGDSSTDIKVGREAGIHPSQTVAIDRGIGPRETLALIRPKVKIIKNLSELDTIIDTL